MIDASPVYVWRCGYCAIRPVLLEYNLAGSWRFHARGRRHEAVEMWASLWGGPIHRRCHAAGCGVVQELYIDETGTIAERRCTCPERCTTE